MMELCYYFFDQKEFSKLRPTIQRAVQDIFSTTDSFFMEVAINEAVNNALKFKCPDQPIRLTIRLSAGNRLIIRIKDYGDGYDAYELLRKISQSSDLLFEEKLYNESGRGMSIIKLATDRLYFNRQGNEILLMKHVERNSDKLADVHQTGVC